MVKQKTMHQSSFRSAAIKTGIFVASAFIIAHAVFGKPVLAGAPSKLATDSTRNASPGFQTPMSIYARLSMQSQALINDLQGLVNKSGLLPASTTVAAPFVLQIISENSESLSLSMGVTVSNLEKRVEALKEMCAKTRDGWLKAKLANLQIKLAVLKTFSEQATPEEQKKLLSELSNTFVVPVAP